MAAVYVIFNHSHTDTRITFTQTQELLHINTNTHPEQRKLRVTLSLSHNRLGHVYFSKSLFLPLITQNFPIFHGKKSVGHSGIGCLILGKKRWREFVMELISSLAGFAATAQIRFFHLCDTDLISSLLSKQ